MEREEASQERGIKVRRTGVVNPEAGSVRSSRARHSNEERVRQ